MFSQQSAPSGAVLLNKGLSFRIGSQSTHLCLCMWLMYALHLTEGTSYQYEYSGLCLLNILACVTRTRDGRRRLLPLLYNLLVSSAKPYLSHSLALLAIFIPFFSIWRVSGPLRRTDHVPLDLVIMINNQGCNVFSLSLQFQLETCCACWDHHSHVLKWTTLQQRGAGRE